MKKIKLLYFNGDDEELSKELKMPIDELWKYFAIEDYDYMLIVDGELKKEEIGGDNYLVDYYFEKLLQGCCENEWVYIKKINKTIGIAYHG